MPDVVLHRLVLVRVAVGQAVAGGSVDGQGVAQIGDAPRGCSFGVVVGAPLVVLALKPAGWLAGDDGFVTEPIEAADDAVKLGVPLADPLVGVVEPLIEVVGVGESAVAV